MKILNKLFGNKEEVKEVKKAKPKKKTMPEINGKEAYRIEKEKRKEQARITREKEEKELKEKQEEELKARHEQEKLESAKRAEMAAQNKVEVTKKVAPKKVVKEEKLDLFGFEVDLVKQGDIVEVGNESVGYQDIAVSTFTERTLTAAGDATANTSLIASHEYTIGLGTNYKLAEDDLNKLSLARKWKYHNSFGKAPQTGNYHVLVRDEDGVITGEAGTILELYEDVATSQSAVLPDGTTNY